MSAVGRAAYSRSVEAFDPAEAAQRSDIGSPIAFRDVGQIELKGASGARRLFEAARG